MSDIDKKKQDAARITGETQPIQTIEKKRPAHSGDKELEEFRSLMEPPSEFDEGFTWPAFIGAIFIALMMVPGSIYMGLLAGMGIGPAARWVTVILFIEVARRANKSLKRAEIYILYWLAGAAMAMPFEGILWNQFFVQSNAAQAHGIAEFIPIWVAPSDPSVLAKRTVFDAQWLPALLMVIFGTFMSRLDNTVLGYGLFRIASDIEKLPFPMAPLGAQGVMALSEEQEEEKATKRDMNKDPNKLSSWRWRVFSIGGAIGLVFGIIYIGLPTVTGALLTAGPIQIFPIPWDDWTQKTKDILPAVATGLSFDLGNVIVGMVLPFYAMLGSFIGLILMFIANPILYHFDILKSWIPGDGTIPTLFKNNIDFYFSFSIGVSFAIAIAGIIAVVQGLRKSAAESKSKGLAWDFNASVPKGRGDIDFKWIIAVYIFVVSTYILVSGYLIDWHKGVMLIMLFYGFIYTPIISYVTARLEGIAGQVINIPFIREASFILSGYKGVAIWFLPIPMQNYGQAVVGYREAELVGVRFWSIWKAQIILTPIVLVASLFFANFIWSLGPIPGAQYPYAQKMWELGAENSSIIYSSTLGGYSLFKEAFKPILVAIGMGIGGLAFALMTVLGWPIFLVYGIVRGLGQSEPHSIIPQFIGALVGRYYFQKRLGLKWRQYIPVVSAGFGCGMGLITTFCIGVTFLIKSVIQLPF